MSSGMELRKRPKNGEIGMSTEFVEVTDLQVGDKIKFYPDSNIRQWWTVAARNDKHVVAVRQAPFESKGTLEYTVTGTMNGMRNGAGPGLVRSSLNSLGGGWDVGTEGELAYTVLESLEDHLELSMRRVIDVHSIEVRND